MLQNNLTQIISNNTEKTTMTNIVLSSDEQTDLLQHYKTYTIDEQPTVELDWVSRKFPSSGRVARLVEKDGSAVIKQVLDLE